MDTPTTVLFLDCDGVINNAATFARAALRNKEGLALTHPYEARMVNVVREVCNIADATLVISSTWRMYDDAVALLNKLFPRNMHPTDPLTTTHAVDGSWVRGAQIGEWLARHPEVTRYAIVDDDRDMLPDQLRHCVFTTWHSGLSATFKNQLIEVLTSDRSLRAVD